MNVLGLLQVQFGLETTWGTPVSGSAKIMGIDKCSFKPKYQTARYSDIRQSLAPGTLGALESVEGAVTMSGKVTYEDFPYFLDGIFSKVSPTGTNPYTYTYTAPTTAAPTPRLFTILWGDSSGTYRLSGGLLAKLTVKGTNNTALTFDAEFVGELVDGSGSLAALSDRAVNVVMGNHGAVYVDAFAGTIGSTALTATAFEFEWMVTSNRVLKKYLGSTAPLGWEGNPYDGSLKLGMEFNATSKAYTDAIFNATPALVQKLCRIQMDSSPRQLQLDMAGNVDGGPELWTDRDGVSTVEMTIAGLYDAGAFANWTKAKVINAVSALA